MTKLSNDEVSKALVETLLGWDDLERGLDAPSVVDFQLTTDRHHHCPTSRWEVLNTLTRLYRSRAPELRVSRRIKAHIAYLRALMGERVPFDLYIDSTLGFEPRTVSSEYIEHRRDALIEALRIFDVPFSSDTMEKLDDLEPRIEAEDVHTVLRDTFAVIRSDFEDLLRVPLSFAWDFEVVNVNDYWSYWVDGTPSRFRLRINRRNAGFRQSSITQFVLHELIAHCGQMEAWKKQIRLGHMLPCFGITSVHTPEQYLFEGLAQTLPALIPRSAGADPLVECRMMFSHYKSLVDNNAHLEINRGGTIEECIALYDAYTPFLRPTAAAASLASRSTNVLFRAYQLVYPQSFDDFLCFSERASDAARLRLTRLAYQEVLYPEEVNKLIRNVGLRCESDLGFFFYGSLARLDVLLALVGRSVQVQPARVLGYGRRVVRGRSYPAAVEAQGKHMSGVFVPSGPQHVAELIDAYEDAMYEVVPVQVELESGSIRTANMYVAGRLSTIVERHEWNGEVSDTVVDEWIRSAAAFASSYHRALDSS